MAKGFYNVRQTQEDKMVFGPLNGAVISRIGNLDSYVYFYIPSDSAAVPKVNGVEISPVTLDSTLRDRLWLIAPLDMKELLKPSPDLIGFFNAIATDTSLSEAARTFLPLTLPILQINLDKPELISTYITALITSNAYPFLTPITVANILQKANTYHLPISLPTNLTSFNMPLFYEGFAKETLNGVFTFEQWQIMAMLKDISDVPFRDQKIMEVATTATPEQLQKLLELATAAGFTLPVGA